MGRFKIRLTPEGSNQVIQMDKPGNARIDPLGWTPYSGERALIYFHSQQAKVGYEVVHVAEKIERIPDKTK